MLRVPSSSLRPAARVKAKARGKEQVKVGKTETARKPKATGKPKAMEKPKARKAGTTATRPEATKTPTLEATKRRPKPAGRPRKAARVKTTTAAVKAAGTTTAGTTTELPKKGSVAIFAGDNLPILRTFAPASFDMIYIDPPFNTGKVQARTQLRTVHDESGGDRVGFQGKRYRTEVLGKRSFADRFDDFLSFLAPRLEEAKRLLRPSGSLFVHLDYREVHYVKVLLDLIFGRGNFVNEIIWAYDYGARSRRRWSPKHDTILWYARTSEQYHFDHDAIDRIPYMAPGLVGPVKAARGKTPTDTWWHTIVSPNGREKTGYPTQKPLGIVRRLVAVHSRPGDRLLDFFAGSGTLGEAAASLGRDVVLVDQNHEAIEVMQRRLAAYAPTLSHHPVKRSRTKAAPRAGAKTAPKTAQRAGKKTEKRVPRPG